MRSADNTTKRYFEEQEKARTQTLRLLLLFALTVLGLVVAVNLALALTWKAASVGGAACPAYFFVVNTGLTLLFVLGGWWMETSALAAGGQVLARRAGAREIWPASREVEHKLENIVAELAIAAGMKAPLVMVVDREKTALTFSPVAGRKPMPWWP